MAVSVFDKRKKPLKPCSEKRARLLLTRDRSAVHPRHPFTVSLKRRLAGDVEPVRVTVDPGRKTTGAAIITDEDGNKAAVNAGRVAIRANGSFAVGHGDGTHVKYCKRLHRADGYRSAWRPALPSSTQAWVPERRRFG